jgi:hypothetical protein
LRVELFSTCGKNGGAQLVREALNNPPHWNVALGLYTYLDVESQKALFPRLLEIACNRHSLTGKFADAVCGFPRQWLLKHIEAFAEPLLKSEEEYWQLLKIYSRLDRQMAARLVARASSSTDPEIREFAKDNAESVS